MGANVAILIASDDEPLGRRIRELFATAGLECPPGHIVPLELAADRASRLVPDLVLMCLGDEFERGLTTLRELVATVRAHCLVVGPADDPKLILSVLHEGADEYLDRAQISTELSAAVVRFKSRQSQSASSGEPCRVLSILGAAGGTGASTVSANVATLLAKAHGRCGLIDLRLEAGDLAALLDLRPVHTLAEFCDRAERVDRTMFDQLFEPHASGVHLLAAPREYTDLPKVTARIIRKLLAMARGRFPYVVVDVSNAFDERQIEALWQADTILIVLRLDYTSIRCGRRILEQLQELGIGNDRVKLVANRYGESRQLRQAKAEEAIGMPIDYFIPADPGLINRAGNAGIPVVLDRPRAKVSRRLAELTSGVNGRVH